MEDIFLYAPLELADTQPTVIACEREPWVDDFVGIELYDDNQPVVSVATSPDDLKTFVYIRRAVRRPQVRMRRATDTSTNIYRHTEKPAQAIPVCRIPPMTDCGNVFAVPQRLTELETIFLEDSPEIARLIQRMFRLPKAARVREQTPKWWKRGGTTGMLYLPNPLPTPSPQELFGPLPTKEHELQRLIFEGERKKDAKARAERVETLQRFKRKRNRRTGKGLMMTYSYVVKYVKNESLKEVSTWYGKSRIMTVTSYIPDVFVSEEPRSHWVHPQIDAQHVQFHLGKEEQTEMRIGFDVGKQPKKRSWMRRKIRDERFSQIISTGADIRHILNICSWDVPDDVKEQIAEGRGNPDLLLKFRLGMRPRQPRVVKKVTPRIRPLAVKIGVVETQPEPKRKYKWPEIPHEPVRIGDALPGLAKLTVLQKKEGGHEKRPHLGGHRQRGHHRAGRQDSAVQV